MPSDEQQNQVNQRHFYSLDALRGLAALSVVFWHWRHFSYHEAALINFDREHQPLFWLFKYIYLNGYRAVDLFFCLSGFIFFWLYGDKVRDRETSLKEFVVLRFSRLYPLHFVSLLIVAAGQILIGWRWHTFFVYPDNDVPHFLLQLVFGSCFEGGGGASFNGPVWSVSAEVICYTIFFLLCFLRRGRWWELILFVALGYYLETHGQSNLGRGFFSFFIGGLAYQLFVGLQRAKISKTSLQVLGVTTALAWVLVPYNTDHYILTRIYNHLHIARFVTIHGVDTMGVLLLKICNYDWELILFPLTIITLALWELRRGTLGKRLAFLGHISYSSYLLHVPLQMVFFWVTLSYSVRETVFKTTWSFLLFFALLIPLSLLSYQYFERPCQSFLRKKLLPKSKRAATVS